MNLKDETETSVSKIDCGIQSLSSLQLPASLVSLNLHSNSIARIERLSHLQRLTHLDLSSNSIAKIAGLQTLTSLRTLNLACNQIASVENLGGLRHLSNLNLAYNKIRSVHGLADLWGAAYSLETLSLAANYLSSLDECTYYLSGLVKLKHLALGDNKFETTRSRQEYRAVLFRMVKSLVSLDGRDVKDQVVNNQTSTSGEPLQSLQISTSDSTIIEICEPEYPIKSRRFDQVTSNSSEKPSSSSDGGSSDPKLDLIEEKIHQLLVIRDKLKITSPSNQSSSTSSRVSRKLSKSPIRYVARSSSSSDETPPSTSETSTISSAIQNDSKHHHQQQRLVGILKSGARKPKSDEDTQKNERKEKEKEETTTMGPAMTHLNEIIKMLRDQLAVYQQSQEASMKTICELKSSLQKAHDEQAKSVRERDEIAQANRQNMQKLNEEIAELKRKLDSWEKAKPKLTAKMEEKLKQHYIKQMEMQKEAYEQCGKQQQDRIASLELSYKSLEDEFRGALTYEAKRYSDLSKSYEAASSECRELKAKLSESETANERNQALVAELNLLIKEQKTRLTGLVQFRKEKQEDVHKRNAQLTEAVAEINTLKEQVAVAKKEKAALENKLKSAMGELDTLRRERHGWQYKLSDQKNFLLNENARIEAEAKQLRSERDHLAESLAREADACKIKAKIIDDQTETIRKLKSAVLERDEIVRKTRDEALEAQKSLDKQLADEMDLNNELRIKLDGYAEVKREYDELKAKWREKSQLIGELDVRVRKMKDEFEKKESELVKSRDGLQEENKELSAQLRKLDDAFRLQYDAEKREHLKQMEKLRRESEERLAASEAKIVELEQEMRQILTEAENRKRFYEDKMANFSHMFNEFQAGLKIS